jgi:hypothetical protein
MSETQVIDTDPNKSVISALASGRPVQATPAVDQPMPPANGQAQGKDIEIVKEAPVAPVTPVTETPVAPVVETDPFLNALRGTTDTPAAWADEAKSLFKQTFGEDDPLRTRPASSRNWPRRRNSSSVLLLVTTSPLPSRRSSKRTPSSTLPSLSN